MKMNHTELANWLSTNNIRKNIEPILRKEKEQAILFHKLKKIFVGQVLDPTLEEDRWLSELGLCAALNKIKLPNGFKVKNGHVSLGSSLPKLNWLNSIGHTFGLGPNDEILCLTFGQFYNPSEQVKPGDRVQFFSNKAPTLIHVYPDYEVAILLGNRRSIKMYFGLDYED